jgi:clan AA aspartic protease (TIGR02281 family)
MLRVVLVLLGLMVGGLAALLQSQAPPSRAAPAPRPAAPPRVEAPKPRPKSGGEEITVPASAFNQCWIDARTTGPAGRSAVLDYLRDTGASGWLTLGRNHAAALGIDTGGLSYSSRYSSANGEGRETFVSLNEFRFHSFVLRDVRAAVTQVDQDMPLLGIEILHRLNLQLKDGNCILTVPSSS